jgi:starch synthase
VQLVILGTGEPRFEAQLRELASRHPQQIGAEIGYDESLAHLVEAGADLFLMPSRFEPCGLNQLYSLRYGAVPLVRRTGGLADTVVDTATTTLNTGKATGFIFDEASVKALVATVHRALGYYRQPALWRQIVDHAMARDYSWSVSAERYLTLYRQALDDARM